MNDTDDRSGVAGWRLPAALATSVAVAAAAWLISSGSHSDGAESDQPSAGRSTHSSPATDGPTAPQHTRPGHAGVAHAAPSQVDAQRPTGLTLPSGVQMPVDATATGSDGELEIPTDINHAGWWDGSSRLGDPFGSIVVAAHVDSFTQGLGHFAELLSMHRGDQVVIRTRDSEQTFSVVIAHLVPKSTLNAGSHLYAATGSPRLVLITCGGDYDSDTGYADNMVVVAKPTGPLKPR